MLNNSSEIDQILDRLLAKTKGGELTWTGGLAENRVNSRFGEYQVILSRPAGAFNAVMLLSDVHTGQTFRFGNHGPLVQASTFADTTVGSLNRLLSVTIDVGTTSEQQYKINSVFEVATGGQTFFEGVLKALR